MLSSHSQYSRNDNYFSTCLTTLLCKLQPLSTRFSRSTSRQGHYCTSYAFNHSYKDILILMVGGHKIDEWNSRLVVLLLKYQEEVANLDVVFS
jgi:hypothetical protein